MPEPKKDSQTIAVDECVYRWHMLTSTSNNDPQYKEVVITPDGVPDGQPLFDGTSAAAIMPASIERLIRRALLDGWQPDGHGRFRLSKKASGKCWQNFKRCLKHGGYEYTWQPDTRDGLYLTIQRNDQPHGQAMTTQNTLTPEILCPELIAAFIDAGLSKGWRSTRRSRACFNLQPALCDEIVAKFAVDS